MTKINLLKGASLATSIGFFAIGKSDRSIRSNRNKIQFLRIITIKNLKVRVI